MVGLLRGVDVAREEVGVALEVVAEVRSSTCGCMQYSNRIFCSFRVQRSWEVIFINFSITC